MASLAPTLGLTPSGPAFETTLYQLAPARDAGLATFADYDAAFGNGVDAPGVLRIQTEEHSGIRPLDGGAPLASGLNGFRVARPNPSIAGLSADDAALEAEAMFQRSRTGVANTSEDNLAALASGSVLRGARLSELACAPCHPAPSFNFHGDGSGITPLAAIATEPSRANFGMDILKVAGTGFQTTVGYKNQSYRFLFATPPYLHDGGLAAADDDGEADVFGVVDTFQDCPRDGRVPGSHDL